VQHLIKVNLIVYAAAIAAGMASLLLLGADPTAAFATATKVASVIQLISLAFIYFAWRFIPGYSFFIFPLLPRSPELRLALRGLDFSGRRNRYSNQWLDDSRHADGT